MDLDYGDGFGGGWGWDDIWGDYLKDGLFWWIYGYILELSYNIRIYEKKFVIGYKENQENRYIYKN